MKLIGLSGKAGTGKDTIANYLHAKYMFQQYALASPIKEGLKAMFGLTDAHFEHPVKEQAIKRYGMSPRRMAQLLGTEFGRDIISEDVWIRRCDEMYQESKAAGFVVSDIRFDDEADWIRENGGQVWHVMRPDATPAEDHVSEHGVTPCKGDILLCNAGTIKALELLVDKTLQEN